MTNTTDNLLARLKEVACYRSRGLSIHIDLETWGKKPGCAIRSIGASVWDNTTGKRVPDAPTFYVNVCKKSCFDKGLTFDADTVRWWEQQGDAAKAALDVDQVSLTQALNDLRCWYGHVINAHGDGYSVSVWGNGKEFDISILEACYAATHQRAPWPFWASADVRTAVLIGRMFGIDVKYNMEFVGTPHFALDDSAHQGQYTAETLHLIKQVFDKGVESLKMEAEATARRIDYDNPHYYDGGNERVVGWVVGWHMDDGAAAFMEAMDEDGDLSGEFTLIDLGRTLRPATEEEIAAWKEACAEVVKGMQENNDRG